jgi:hypothetical protein
MLIIWVCQVFWLITPFVIHSFATYVHIYESENWELTKGQIISECPYEIIVSP